ncbi:hypothetical protein MtrunA17_Chr4g0022281 [Medicago truncatula]|uniref:Uncharacterized protein n=1 Tax=Medicago truncatula TaxID=3880 RepID=A0A396I3D6_MEDTR|nr:hypothetical protein MtrunA17_Chr4g0022281 [Medicago truncatula]
MINFICKLHFLFGKNFEGATRIVDQRGVKRISGNPSGRFIFQHRHFRLKACRCQTPTYVVTFIVCLVL